MNKIVKYLLILCFVSSCTTNKVATTEELQSRSPASEQIRTAPEPTEENLASITDTSELKYRISNWVRYYIILGAHMQKILASFDVKLDEALSTKQESVLEEVKTELREIECQSMELMSVNHDIDDRLKIMFKAVVERRDPALMDWFIERLAAAPNFDTPAQILARLNYLKSLKAYNEEICKDSVCRAANFSKSRLRFPFHPYKNEEILAYRKTHSKKIALFFANPISRTSSCLSRNPAAAAVPGTNYFGLNLAPNMFSVTYDDGPHPINSLEILNQWVKSGLAKPVFFLLAGNASGNPNVVKEISKSGAEVACHTFNHPNMSNLLNAKSVNDFQKENIKIYLDGQPPIVGNFETWKMKTLNNEINGATDTIEKILKSNPVSPQTKITKFRFPYGNGYDNAFLLNMLKARNMVHFHWTVDSQDYADSNPLSVYERVLKGMALRGRGVILFHDLYPQTVEATKMLVDYFKKNKTYKVVNLNTAL